MVQKQIIIKGLLVNYYVEGGGSAPIIFLHGWRSEGAVWLPLFNNLTTKPSTPYFLSYTFYALDLPGFGNSEMPKNPFALHDYAEMIREFITKIHDSLLLRPLADSDGQAKFRIQDVIIIGHSFGARIAIKLAAQNPQLIQKLVLIGSGGARPWWRRISICIAKLFKPFFAPRFMQPFRKKIYTLIGAEDYLATPALTQTFLNAINENLMPLCPSIQCPTLIIWGENDLEARLAYGQKMARAIPNAKLAVIKNAGHFCFLDQPEQCIGILQAFLK